MEKKMCSYETLYVINGNLSEEEMKTVSAKFSALVSEHATDVAVDEWGKRRLAYPINYVSEGYYILVSYTSEPSFPLEFQRVLGITDGIMRSMTTRKPEGKNVPAAVPAAQAAADATAAQTETEATAE